MSSFRLRIIFIALIIIVGLWLLFDPNGTPSQDAHLAGRDAPDTSRPLPSREIGQVPLSTISTLEGNRAAVPLAVQGAAPAEESERSQAIRGRVLTPDGRPADGEDVVFYQQPRGPERSDPQPHTTRLGMVKTDSMGEFSFRPGQAPDVLARILPTDEALAESISLNCTPGDYLVLQLRLAGAVAGNVQLAGERPDTARLQVSARSRYGRFVDSWPELMPDGGYFAGRLEPGEYVLTVQQAGFPACNKLVEIEPRRIVIVDFPLEHLKQIHGRVVDARTLFPVSGAEVDLRWSFSQPILTAQDGRFQLMYKESDDSPCAGYCRADGYGTVQFELKRNRASDDGEVVVELNSEAEVRGQIVDPAGEPIEGADVRTVSMRNNGAFGVLVHEAKTSPEGTFAIGALDPSFDTGVVVRKVELGTIVYFIPRDSSARSWGDVGKLVMHPACGLIGRIVDSAGNGLEGFTIRLRGYGTEQSENSGLLHILEWISQSEGAVSSRTGEFSFSDLNAGRYEVEAVFTRAGGEQSKRVLVDLFAGMPDPYVELRFGNGLSIKGVLRGASGTPLAGGFVILYSQSDQLGSPRGTTASSDEGQFHFHELPPGLYCLSVQLPREVRLQEGAIQSAGSLFRNIEAGATDLDLTLPEASTISGYVLDSNEKPVKGAFVFGKADNQIIDWTRSEERGAFTLFAATVLDISAAPARLIPERITNPEVVDNRPDRKVVKPAVDPGTQDLILRLPFPID